MYNMDIDFDLVLKGIICITFLNVLIILNYLVYKLIIKGDK